MCSVHCKVISLQWSLFSVHCALCSVQCTMCTIKYASNLLTLMCSVRVHGDEGLIAQNRITFSSTLYSQRAVGIIQCVVSGEQYGIRRKSSEQTGIPINRPRVGGTGLHNKGLRESLGIISWLQTSDNLWRIIWCLEVRINFAVSKFLIDPV